MWFDIAPLQLEAKVGTPTADRTAAPFLFIYKQPLLHQGGLILRPIALKYCPSQMNCCSEFPQR